MPSASERLRELATKYHRLAKATPPAGENFAVDYLGPLANLSGDYAQLLPLIADVVEAAERRAELDDFNFGATPTMESNPQLTARKRLAAALTALRDVLEEK